jgi:hypothetical protein
VQKLLKISLITFGSTPVGEYARLIYDIEDGVLSHNILANRRDQSPASIRPTQQNYRKL